MLSTRCKDKCASEASYTYGRIQVAADVEAQRSPGALPCHIARSRYPEDNPHKSSSDPPSKYAATIHSSSPIPSATPHLTPPNRRPRALEPLHLLLIQLSRQPHTRLLQTIRPRKLHHRPGRPPPRPHNLYMRTVDILLRRVVYALDVEMLDTREILSRRRGRGDGEVELGGG
jgi:hypothetical protein